MCAIKVEPFTLRSEQRGFDASDLRRHAFGCLSGYAAAFESFRTISLRPQALQAIQFHHARIQFPPFLPSKKVQRTQPPKAKPGSDAFRKCSSCEGTYFTPCASRSTYACYRVSLSQWDKVLAMSLLNGWQPIG